MKIVKVNETPIAETPHKVDVRKLYDKESAQVMHITLLPGEELKPHITPVDVCFFILDGEPSIKVGEEIIQVSANSLVESPKDIVHCIYNYSTQPARILVIKAPRPNKPTKVL